MKENAERLAREKAERQKRELEAQVERNRRELRKEERDERRDAEPSILVGFAEPELPEEPKGEEILEFCCRFRGTRENLKAMREWMSAHNIAYEKL
jgi:ABC-type multidrug transport system ATPase subunit